MPETENFVLLLGRSDISLLSILIWSKTFFKWQTRDLCTFRNRAVSCGFLPARKAFGTAARVSYFAETFLEQKMIFLHCLIPEMDSFP
jgi:hypothetical protein